MQIILEKCHEVKTICTFQACMYCIDAINSVLCEALQAGHVDTSGRTDAKQRFSPSRQQQYFISSPLKPERGRLHAGNGIVTDEQHEKENMLIQHFNELETRLESEELLHSCATTTGSREGTPRSSNKHSSPPSSKSLLRRFSDKIDDDGSETDEDWQNLQVALQSTRQELQRKLSNISNTSGTQM
jgi:hypothetical protein